jgi:hypothetical protein
LIAATRECIPDFVRRLEIEFWDKWASPAFPAMAKELSKLLTTPGKI